MLHLCSRLLCAVTLANGTVLKGDLNPNNRNQLLKGVAVLPDGRTYSGSFHPSSGFPLPGSQLEEDGDLYKGCFNERWQREGKGESWLADGTYYNGRFVADELVEGLVRIPNGTSEMTFEGTLRDESFVHGRLAEHDFTYEGDFRENQPHGKGKLVFATGAEQEGTFFAGKLHGCDCKLKLDSGFVYVGEFVDGKIRRGTLYTPTYTYEGEFDDHGRANGEGAQTYLANEPRLTFSGVWSNGALVRGVCVDEYGTPVDWQDNHQLQRTVLAEGGAPEDSDASIAINSYCSAKLKEADTMHRDMDASYARDAEQVEQQTGTFPSRMDLGYEGSIAQENEAVEGAMRQQMEDIQQSKQALTERAAGFDSIAGKLRESGIVAEINENMAKIQFSRQMGAQELAAQRVDEQFERFLKTFDRPSAASQKQKASDDTVARSRDDDEEDDDTVLEIDGNAPWKAFTPQKVSGGGGAKLN